MLPSAFVLLEALPLTANGKLDRARLPSPERGPASVARPPRDALEAQLADLWQELLGVPAVGASDDFFELGGHSLLAARLIQLIGDLYGVQLPLTTLHVRPTVEGLAEAVRRGDGRETAAPVVKIHGAGSRPPLFFFHGDLDGGGFYCLKLARRLGAEPPFYIVRPLGHDGGPVPATIELMAERHLTAMREVRPHGPWRLGGYCNGGLVAYEIARHLAAAGETVELVVLVAAAPDLRLARLRALGDRAAALLGVTPARGQDLFARLRSFLWRLDGLPPRDRLALLARHAAKLAGRVAAAAGRHDPESADDTYDRYFRAVMGYVPGPFPGRIVLFWPAAQPGGSGDPTRGWGRLAGRVDVHVVPGDHSTACVPT
jgi:thioesterase domain-containing protein/acyl carrier protein